MKTTIFSILLTLLCASWALAQQPYGQSSQSTPSSSSGSMTVKGCLNKSDGDYTLTDKSGNMYQLTGDTSKLSAHVGHEVEITGTQSGKGTGDSAAATQQSAQHQIEVSRMKHISETCTSGASSGKSSGSDDQKPMSEKPPNK